MCREFGAGAGAGTGAGTGAGAGTGDRDRDRDRGQGQDRGPGPGRRGQGAGLQGIWQQDSFQGADHFCVRHWDPVAFFAYVVQGVKAVWAV